MNKGSPKEPNAGRLSVLLAVILFTASCPPAYAADPGGSVVATSDYVFRGLTQTDHSAAVQGDLHLRTSGGWFAGVWASAAFSKPEVASQTEVNFYLGHAWALAPDWTASAHYARYLYPDDRPYVQYYYDEYDELQVSVDFQTRVSFSLAFTPEILRYSLSDSAVRRGKQWAYEGSFRQPLWRTLSFTAGVGYYDLGDLFDKSYWAWSGGVELVVRQVQFNLSRFGADAAARRMFERQTADGRWALTATWRF